MADTLKRRMADLAAIEVLASLLLLGGVGIALAAFFSGADDAASVLGYATLDLFVWTIWLWAVLRRPAPPWGGRGALRRLAPFLAVLFLYDLGGRLLPLVHPPVPGLFIAASGSWLFAGAAPPTSSLAVQILSLLYLVLPTCLLALGAFHLLVRRVLYPRFVTGFLILYGLAWVGALLFPASAPRLADEAAWQGLRSGAFLWVDLACCRIRPFPSLHGTLAAFLFFWQWRHDREGLSWGLPVALGGLIAAWMLGDLYPAGAVSGILTAGLAHGLAPRFVRVWARFRAATNPPVTWLTDVVEDGGEGHGKLVERLALLLPLGGAVPPGVVYGKVPRHRGEESLRAAVAHWGEGPFWLRPSDESGSRKNTLLALKPLSREQALRTIFLAGGKKSFLLQKALKVAAVGLCRSHPSRTGELPEAWLRATLLPRGEMKELRFWPGRLFGGRVEGPWLYYPKDFPVRGRDLRELVKLARRWARSQGSSVEVEWVLSEGRVYILDGRLLRAGSE